MAKVECDYAIENLKKIGALNRKPKHPSNPLFIEEKNFFHKKMRLTPIKPIASFSIAK
jgi:hypothetical protein